LTAFCVWTWSILDAYNTARKFQQQQKQQTPPTSEGGQNR